MTADATEDRMVTVCDACFTACCWQGIFLCEESRSAGTTELPVSKLREMALEHSDYWAKP